MESQLEDGCKKVHRDARPVHQISCREKTTKDGGTLCHIGVYMQFPGHFDMCLLHQKLEEMNFHVSRATVYNTVDVLVDSGLIVRHQLTAQAVQYELRMLAETHLHLICMKCGAIREQKDATLKKDVGALKISRFTPEYHALYIYGLCSKCKYRLQRKK